MLNLQYYRTTGEIMKKASAKAFRGGVAGMAAGVIQVCTFMWMRTLMNYQVRSPPSSIKHIISLSILIQLDIHAWSVLQAVGRNVTTILT